MNVCTGVIFMYLCICMWVRAEVMVTRVEVRGVPIVPPPSLRCTPFIFIFYHEEEKEEVRPIYSYSP